MKNLPSLSIITCTLNADRVTFKQSLESIKMQKYPKKLIEHLVIDGGSSNETLDLAKKYGCKIFIRKDLQERELVRQSIGFIKAKGKILLVLETDNILTTPNWIKEMVRPFMENKDIFCTFSAYNSYKKNMSLLTRYTALFGCPEPTVYYLGKSEKIPLGQKKYNKGKILQDKNGYYVVEFNPINLPACGDNGHMILASAMETVNKNSYEYTHLDAILKLVKMKYVKFGVVKNSIIHVGKKDIFSDVKRKIQLKTEYYDKERGKRKYLIYNPESSADRKNLIKYVIISITFVIPLFESIKGYIKIRDTAWFLHPILCFFMVVGYGMSEVRYFLKRI